MNNIFSKVLTNPRTVIVPDSHRYKEEDILNIKEKLHEKVRKLFKGSLAIREIDAGSTNACEQELTALTNPYYDIERFGIHFVASPKHADMLMVTGPVSRNMAEALKRAYECTPDPKIVVAVGDDAIDGGIFKGSYAVLDGVDKVVPLHFSIPGDPPSPEKILYSLLFILDAIDNNTSLKQ